MCGPLAGIALWGLLVVAQAPAKPEPRPEKNPEAAAGRLGEQLRKHPAKPSARPNTAALFLLDTETGEITRIVDEAVPGLTDCRLAEWSNDGRRIVFQACDNNWWRAQLLTIELGREKPLVTPLGLGVWPSITHDAEKILFVLYEGMAGATESGFWVMNADGTERKKIEQEGRPKLGPGSRFCLICSWTKPPTLRLVDTEAEKLHEVQLPDRKFFSWPSWVDRETFVSMTGQEVGDHVSLIDVSNPDRIAIKEDLWTRPAGSALRPRSPVYVARAGKGYFIAREPGRLNAVYEFKRGKAETRRFDAAVGEDMDGLGISPGGRYLLFSSDRAGK